LAYAIVNSEGLIGHIAIKLSPFMKLAAGERIASYDPPEVDENEFTLVAIEPIDPQDQAVRFEMKPIAGAVERAKAKKNAAINAARLAANTSTFSFQGKLIAVDALSRSDIDGAHGYISAMKAMPPGWPGGWKADDNTYVAINTFDEWMPFYSAMVASGTANFSRAQALKAQVATCSTVEQVRAVPDW
jgi:hypothetical protein